MRFLILLCIFCISSLHTEAFSANSRETYQQLTLVGINIIDRNGVSETICAKDKLKKYQRTNFLDPQPYQKVVRTYKNRQGEQVSCITTYHPNAQLHQYLECVNNRACGLFREWFANGKIKIQANIVGGIADLHPSAETSWIFDGTSYAYFQDGSLRATIAYHKGELTDTSVYYHRNGRVWKTIPYKHGKQHGTVETWTPQGTLLKTESFHMDRLNGACIRYGNETTPYYSQEYYEMGKLISGKYFNPEDNSLVAEIVAGQGTRCLFNENHLIEQQQYFQGEQNGLTKIFDTTGKYLLHTYHIYRGEKHGEEVFFYPKTEQPKNLFTWHQGTLHGTTKSWYASGQLESTREFLNNEKNGILTVYYPNGQLMLSEEYEHDQLICGEYYRLGDKRPCATVLDGNGTAMLFSPSGGINKKIVYKEGKPLL